MWHVEEYGLVVSEKKEHLRKRKAHRARARKGGVFFAVVCFFKLGETTVYIIGSGKLNREEKVENTGEREDDTLDKVQREMGGNPIKNTDGGITNH